MSETRQLDVSILGREFRVGCPPEEEAALLRSVEYVDARMREIRDSGRVVGVERIAIMTALNLAHSQLAGTPLAQASFDCDHTQRAQALVEAIDRALASDSSSPAAAVQLQIL